MGKLALYVSNESNWNINVFFDDLSIEHEHSPVIADESYYPFGGLHAKRENRQNNYLWSGKERQFELGLDWDDFGARFYDPMVGRFFTQDRFAEKYAPLSPYNYAANNPINFIDINGDSIWVTSATNTQTFDNGMQHTTINHTIHITGKVLNNSDSWVNVGDVASGIQSELNSASASQSNRSGNNTFTTNISVASDIQVAESMDDVSASDHLITIVDDVLGQADSKGGGGNAGGLAARSGKISYIESNSLSSGAMVSTGVHEIGHNLGFGHNFSDPSNHMSYSNSGSQFSFGQLRSAVMDSKNGRLNQGSNYSIARQSSGNWLWHRSTNEAPYDFNVTRGQRIPRVLLNR